MSCFDEGASVGYYEGCIYLLACSWEVTVVDASQLDPLCVSAGWNLGDPVASSGLWASPDQPIWPIAGQGSEAQVDYRICLPLPIGTQINAQRRTGS